MENKISKFVLVFFLFAISNHFVFTQTIKSNDKKLNIELITVSAIEITKIKTSKKLSKPKKLTKSQINDFINAWNKTESNANCPIKYNFEVTIDFQDYTRRKFYIDKNIVSENKIQCYNLNDQALIEKLLK